MQEDDKEASESQPEPEGQPPSGSEAGESQPEPEGQPPRATSIPPAHSDSAATHTTTEEMAISPGPRLGVYLAGLSFWWVMASLLGTTGGVFNAISTSLIGVILYIVELIVTIVFIARKDVLFAGYGLLTAFLATPVVVVIGC